jgi:SAM-dependent methyltransferase
MLPRTLLKQLVVEYPRSTPVLLACGLVSRDPTDEQDQPWDEHARVKQLTAKSYGYGCQHFGNLEGESDARERWYFAERMRPHPPESFDGRLVLDVGSGSGIHSARAAEAGAAVVAVDLSVAIDGARRNLPREILTVQADAEHLPFDHGTFDFIMSLGVLHHLPDPEAALRSLVPYVRVDGHVHLYLYWVPTRRWHRLLLGGVNAVRSVTELLPNRLFGLLCYPLAVGPWAMFVMPYGALRNRRRGQRIAQVFPLKAYADFRFSAFVGSLFDYLHTPIQMRYTRDEVRSMMAASGLTRVSVIADNGWIADGTPAAAAGEGAIEQIAPPIEGRNSADSSTA